MTDKRIIADPATHYGSPKGATRGFLVQRITGGLNIVFLAFLVWLVVRLAGADRAEMVMVLQDHPVVSIVLGLLIVSVMVHMRIGMREIVEDYLADRVKRLALTVNDVFVLGVGLLSLASLVKIVFWG